MNISDVLTTQNESVILYTTEISCYDSLHSEYLQHCKDNDLEPESNGEYTYHNEMCDIQRSDFEEYILPNLEKQANNFLAVGSNETWRGRQDGGYLSSSLKTLIDKFSDKLDGITVSYNANNGSVNLSGYHHDGTNHYTVVALNKRGDNAIGIAERKYEDIQSRSFHAKLAQEYNNKKLMYS